MYRLRLLVVLLLWSSLVPSAAYAQSSGTPEEQKACNRDVQRHCRPVINQGDFAILGCLQQNRAKISRACNQVLKNHGQ
jgi:hypothetical protein